MLCNIFQIFSFPVSQLLLDLSMNFFFLFFLFFLPRENNSILCRKQIILFYGFGGFLCYIRRTSVLLDYDTNSSIVF